MLNFMLRYPSFTTLLFLLCSLYTFLMIPSPSLGQICECTKFSHGAVEAGAPSTRQSPTFASNDTSFIRVMMSLKVIIILSTSLDSPDSSATEGNMGINPTLTLQRVHLRTRHVPTSLSKGGRDLSRLHRAPGLRESVYQSYIHIIGDHQDPKVTEIGDFKSTIVENRQPPRLGLILEMAASTTNNFSKSHLLYFITTVPAF